MKKQIRLGMIGTGNICCGGHLPQHAQIEDFVVTAMYDVDAGAMAHARDVYIEEAKKYGRAIAPESIRLCRDAEELFSLVDAVDICTSLRYHAYYAHLALEHGVCAMSEKPMARTWLEAARVAHVAQSAAGVYQLNDDNLFIPRFLVAKALIDGGHIGDIESVRIARGTPSSQRAQWFYTVLEGGGGAILDYGSHAVTNAWSLIGFDKTPVEVRSMGVVCREKTRVVEGRMQNVNIDDDAHFKVLFRDPKTDAWIDVSVEATWTWQHYGERSSDVDGYFEVQGTLGTLTTVPGENGAVFIRLRSRTMGERLFPVDAVESEEYSFRCEFINFARAIQTGNQPFLNADTGSDTIAIINAAQLSEQRGRHAVTLEELKRVSAGYLTGAKDVWEASDRLVADLNRQFIR